MLIDNLKKITIKTVPKKQIRNKSVGDYRQKGKHLQILVANSKDKVFDTGVAMHELTESLLAKKRKIPFAKIDKFDRKHKNIKGEPGELKGAPYFKEHAVANKTEKMLVRELKKKINA